MFKLIYKNYNLIAGVDEVGCGALAGPVVAAAVILNEKFKIHGLKDSKKISIKNRLYISKEIKKKSLDWHIGVANAQEVDKFNILNARMIAMKRAILGLNLKPSYIFIDGNKSPNISIPIHCVVNGDNIIKEISAASIIAKVIRDSKLNKIHSYFPEYNFNKNKGYPTKDHILAIRKFGVTNLHRLSFSPMSSFIHIDHK
ncbi:Ribonuclease HII [Buchnera aphidicola (Neophyllaphis podocarpi)]|uniref:ribonuclease HII n=1 Tax=Buchnera aphidicola TaxID=9 RepID=UPI0034647571